MFKVLEQNLKGYFASINYFGTNQSKYKGYITRGLFKSEYGLVNADIDGSLNILRKVEKCIPDLV